MEGHPEQHRRNWQLMLENYSILVAIVSPTNCADTEIVSGHFARCFKTIEAESRQEMSTFEIEQQLLEQFLRNT